MSVPDRVTSLEIEQAEQRFEQLTEQVKRPAKVVTHTRQRPVRAGARGPSRWRDGRSVRRAFVASLVFAPPKSFDP
jgi:phosphoenolpyruvate carboxylase